MMTNNEDFENVKNSLLGYYKSQLERLGETEKQLLEAQKNNDTKKINIYIKRINSIRKNINNIKNRLACMRLNTEEDLRERYDILTNFPRLINEIIPDDIPIVFHGNSDINSIKQIITSGGLFTPEERGESSKSFATQIDVTYKSNTRITCEFADSSITSFMPYGAIFVFYPKEHEYENVLSTGKSSEVAGGVESIYFSEDRFIGIITTNENLEGLKRYFEENELDPNKVFTYQQFLDSCEEKFIHKTKISR